MASTGASCPVVISNCTTCDASTAAPTVHAVNDESLSFERMATRCQATHARLTPIQMANAGGIRKAMKGRNSQCVNGGLRFGASCRPAA